MLFKKKKSIKPAAALPAELKNPDEECSGTTTEAIQIEDIVQVIETSEAERFVGALFRRKFGANPPDFPRHFVALYAQDGSTWQAVGYVNFWQRQTAFMGGGLVIEDRVYRRMPASHRSMIKSSGGIAEYLLKNSLRMLPDNDVVWGYVGDTQAEKIDLRVGFEHTHIARIMAYWTRSHSAEEKIRLVNEIAEVGPF